MTKDQIIKKYCIGVTAGQVEFDYEKAEQAMDEYAKQQSLAFAQHLHFNYQPHAGAEMWYDHHKDPKGYNPLTTEDIYKQFIEQQNKQ
jgi:hypothetical protein